MANRYKDWMKQAAADYRHAENALASRDFEWSCFAAQQAAEKALECANEIIQFCNDKIH